MKADLKVKFTFGYPMSRGRPGLHRKKEGRGAERREGRREKQRVAERGKDERKYKERRLDLDVPQMCTCWV